MRAYYNEIDSYAAQWIRNLIKAGHVTDGEVDERSIVDVVPSDLRGFDRCHFFAGVAVWDYALGLACWPAERPVWTGSCPCQPFSAAGKGGGFDDERHLWPAWHHLIRECRPATVLGEQVASKDGLGWLDLVHADLEGEGYAVGAADLCAAGVGAPHIRQRLWFVADAERERFRSQGPRAPCAAAGAMQGENGQRERLWPVSRSSGANVSGLLAVSAESGSQGRLSAGQRPDTQLAPAERGGAASVLGDAGSEGRCQVGSDGRGRRKGSGAQGLAERPLHERARSYWSDADWIACRDGKARPVEPGTFPLAHGAPARVGRLRAYGNAINAEAAACFIGAVREARP